MITVVVDTNVVISATLTDDGLPASIFDLVARKKIRMSVSPQIIKEYEEVLRRPNLKLSEERIEKALALCRSSTEMVHPTRKLNLAEDLGDNLFYECADASGADFLITGNNKHFLVGHDDTQIVTPREFIERLGSVLLEWSAERRGF